MRLRGLLADDGAVSPVIGVILMVAITVILAAVIASFVLGLGQQAGTVAPQTTFTFDYQEPSGTSYDGDLTITHDSGDPVVASELYLRGTGFPDPLAVDNETWVGYIDGGNGTMSGQSEGESAVVAGDRAELPADSDYEINVVWEVTEGTDSATLASDRGPGA